MKFKKKKTITRWHQKRFKDTYFKEAKLKGYRSRSVFKLIDINKKFRILKFNYVQRPYFPKMITLTCMILHNFIILNERQSETEIEITEFDAVERGAPDSVVPNMQRDAAKRKRDELINKRIFHFSTNNYAVFMLSPKCAFRTLSS